MSVDLSKCKVGDKVKAANGKIGAVVLIDTLPSDYPLLIKINNMELWYSNDGVLAGCLSDNEKNIVEVISKGAAMVDLSKVKVGDTIKRRDGTTHLVTAISLITEGDPIYPIRIDYTNYTMSYMKNGLYYDDTTCNADICEVIPKETECVKPPTWVDAP